MARVWRMMGLWWLLMVMAMAMMADVAGVKRSESGVKVGRDGECRGGDVDLEDWRFERFRMRPLMNLRAKSSKSHGANASNKHHERNATRTLSQRERTILMVAHGFKENVEPLVLIATELASRGFNVHFATHDAATKWIPETRRLQVESLGPLSVEEEALHGIIDLVGLQTSPVIGMRHLLWEVYLASMENTYESVSKLIEQINPGHVVIDGLAFGAMEASDDHGVPVIINCPTSMLSFVVNWKDSRQPAVGSGYPMNMSLWEMGYNALIPFISRNILYLVLQQLDTFKSTDTITRRSYVDDVKKKTILVNTAFGFEPPLPVAPNIQFTGVVVPVEENADVLAGQDQGIAETFYNCESKRIILVYYGQLGMFTRIKELTLTALYKYCLVIVSPLLNEDSGFSRIIEYETDRITLLETDETNTWEILQDRAIDLVVSSCDLRFAQMAILNRKPLVCIPLYGDQVDVAARVVDVGVGLTVDKSEEDLKGEISATTKMVLKRLKYFKRNCSRITSIFSAQGQGLYRAADIIHESVFNGNASMKDYIPPSGRDTVDVLICLFFIATCLAMVLNFAMVIMDQLFTQPQSS